MQIKPIFAFLTPQHIKFVCMQLNRNASNPKTIRFLAINGNMRINTGTRVELGGVPCISAQVEEFPSELAHILNAHFATASSSDEYREVVEALQSSHRNVRVAGVLFAAQGPEEDDQRRLDMYSDLCVADVANHADMYLGRQIDRAAQLAHINATTETFSAARGKVVEVYGNTSSQLDGALQRISEHVARLEVAQAVDS